MTVTAELNYFPTFRKSLRFVEYLRAEYLNSITVSVVAKRLTQSINNMQFSIRSLFLVVALVVMCASVVLSRPAEDLEAAASGHEHGRVQIKVYRGPTEHDGHDHFAPWGYWVKQPADDDHH